MCILFTKLPVNKNIHNECLSVSYIWMWELDHKEGWALTNWCFQTVLLEKMLENPLDSKKIKPVNPKGNKPWIFIGRTDAEAEAPILWSPDAKSWLIGKDSDAGKDWGWKEKRVVEDEMVRYHWLNGHKSENTLGDSEGQRNLHATVHGVAKCQTWLSDWTTTINAGEGVEKKLPTLLVGTLTITTTMENSLEFP